MRFVVENDFSFRKWVLERYVLGVQVLFSRTRPELPVHEGGWVLFTTREKCLSLPMSAHIQELPIKTELHCGNLPSSTIKAHILYVLA